MLEGAANGANGMASMQSLGMAGMGMPNMNMNGLGMGLMVVAGLSCEPFRMTSSRPPS